MKIFVILLLLLSIQAASAMELRVDPQGNPIIEQFSEEGFIDCVLKISDLEETNKSYKFHLAASHDGEVLGMNVEVIKGIKSGFDSETSLIQEHVYKKGVVFRRSGVESDRLITVLAKLYGFKNKVLKMVQEESFTGIALHQGEINMAAEPIKIKIFGKDSEIDLENDYYESFFNLDLVNGFVYWNEKDQEYRGPLIRGLSQ
jgi:hypothetical protein